MLDATKFVGPVVLDSTCIPKEQCDTVMYGPEDVAGIKQEARSPLFNLSQ